MDNTLLVPNKVSGKLEIIDLTTGENVYHPKELANWQYTPSVGREIVQRVREGDPITAIGRREGCPPTSVLYSWIRLYPDFKEAIDLAKKERAEIYRDKIAESSEDTIEKEDVAAEKLRFDQLKWLAEKADPQQYGNQTKITGDLNAPLTLIVDTGIRRSQNKTEELLPAPTEPVPA